MLLRGEPEVALTLGTVGCQVPVAVILVPQSITNPELLLEYRAAADEYGQEIFGSEPYRVTEPGQVLEVIAHVNFAPEASGAELRQRYWATVRTDRHGYSVAIQELLAQLPYFLLKELVEGKEEDDEDDQEEPAAELADLEGTAL
jgi:hypothetical protein